MSHSIISVVVDSEAWDGSLSTGMLAVVSVPRLSRPLSAPTYVTAEESTALQRAWDNYSDL
jgi:hypothetical protein